MTPQINIHSAPILQYLRKYGQQLDLELAAAMEIPIQKVRTSLADLSARGEISSCTSTRYNDGKPVHGMLVRIAGSTPMSAPGRKPGTPVA